MRNGIVWEKDEIKPRLKTMKPQLDAVVGAYMEYESGVIQSDMRTNARWTDRTSNARNGLMAVFEKGDKRYVITMFHSVPYGIWLEVRWSGRYAIILPTLEMAGPRVMRGISKIMRGLK